MADYKTALNLTLLNEDPDLSGEVRIDNNGGKVRFGLNSKAHPELIDFYTVSRDDAFRFAAIYYNEWYWNPVRGLYLVSQVIANKLFDQAVVCNVAPAVTMAQRALQDMSIDLKDDGHLGPITLYNLNTVNPDMFLTGFKVELEKHYRRIVDAHPEDAQYLNGWLARARA